MSKKIFSYVFKNGNRIEITERGFTMWDGEDGRWVIDASTVSDKSHFSISSHSKNGKLKGLGFVTIDSKYKVKKRAKK